MSYDPYLERPSSLIPALVLGLMAVGGVLSVSTMLSAHPAIDTAPTAKIGPVQRWTDRDAADVNFALEVADFTKAAPVYTAEVQSASGNQRDTIQQGDEKRFIRLTILRAPANAVAKPADFYVDMVRRSADAGLTVSKASQPQIVATRFGKMEVAELALSGQQGALGCAGIRLNEHAPQFAVSGLMCGMSLPLNVEKIACLADRLELKSGDDADLIDIFTNADQISACKNPRIKQVKVPVTAQIAPPAPKHGKKHKKILGNKDA